MSFSPLEQFKILVVQPISIMGLDISITNSTLYLLLATFFIYVIVKRGTELGRIVPDGMQRLAELMYIFVNNLVKQQGGIRSLKYFPLLFVLFYMILFLNLIGLTPFGFTCTSHISYTATLGFSFFIGIVVIGIVVHKVNFYKLFVPDISGAILPIIVVIEIFSYLIRPISLSVRLFANMLAGHSLLHILAGFGMSMLKMDVLVALLMAGPIIAVCVLELGIAFIQAYVFLVLVCIYMKESFYGH